MTAILRALRHDDGAIAVEYSMMLALVLITALSAITILGNRNGAVWGDIKTQATEAFETASSDGPEER